MAVTPIARYDVVPYQRIESTDTFNFGVVAFSKAGIEKVVFTISGQSYGGTSPITVTSMILNSRTGVYEYWTPIAASDFGSDGVFTVQAVITGNDAQTRDLGTLSLVVDRSGSLAQYEAWADGTNGNDGTGEVGNPALPYLTIAAAVAACQTANGGSSDGNIIHIEEGTYTLGSTSVSTTNEWLILKAASGAAKASVIINNGTGSVRTTNKLCFQGLTLQSTGAAQYITTSGYTTNLWVNDCRLIGSGRHTSTSWPVAHTTGTYWCTDTYVYDVDYAFRLASLVRGAEIERVGDDVFERTPCVIDCTVTDVDPASTYWHADAWQMFTQAAGDPDLNCIIYNLKATDLHYQGLFMRDGANIGPVKNIAFVNCLVEMREPGRQGGAGGNRILGALSFYESWEHVVMWHCTFPLGSGSIYPNSMQKSSFIGNVFWQFRNDDSAVGNTDVPWLDNGNVEDNECLYNHFMWVYSLNGPCTPTSADDDAGYPCPHLHSKKPDSGSPVTATHGGSVLTSSWYPVIGSDLIDGVPSIKVPCDVYNNIRAEKADIGAIENMSAPNKIVMVVL